MRKTLLATGFARGEPLGAGHRKPKRPIEKMIGWLFYPDLDAMTFSSKRPH
jgi:hypothetical protein